MLTWIEDQDDRQRGSRGVVLSVAKKDDGTLRVSLDQVVAKGRVLPNEWCFRVFDSHFVIDQGYLDLVESEMSKPDDERTEHGIGVPDAVLIEIGQSFIGILLDLVIDAGEARPS